MLLSESSSILRVNYKKNIERMGTGILDMTTRCVDYGLPEPSLKMRDGFVATIFRKKGLAFEKVIEESGGEKIIDKSVTGGQTGSQTGDQMISEVQQKIIDIVVENPKISRKEISNMLNINTSAIQKHFEKLKKMGIIHRDGGDFGG
ncbi:MAG: winged helix-turn-helix transcriptional regulator, partial [Tannerella sp.]|jgi:predicted HTH transcriptional regulator|nr:winged helix-turn-helix transcriptional regulator [Tannerella sp.]